MLSKKINNWLKVEKNKNKISVKVISLSKLDKWNYTKTKISHRSGKFFKIIGLKVKTNFFKKNWDQPIIEQKEVGILGIIKNNHNKYLLQAKVEPGNKNKLQISPTVQATKSNYTQIHGGKKIPYLKYFLNTKKDYIRHQSEQGFRYLNKFNSNIIINIKKKLNLMPGFFWFSLDDLESLIKKKNTLNMDTISVFSSFIKKTKFDKPQNSLAKINHLIKLNDKKFFIKKKIIPLYKLKDWNFTPSYISHKKNKHFSIIGTKILTNKREVNKWCQPIIKGKGLAMAGFLIKEINKTPHYLCRYILKPGLKKSVITCTVNTSDIKNYKIDQNLSTYQKKLFEFFLSNKKINKNNKTLYNNILSDEGGRFYHCQIKNIAILIKKNIKIKLPNTYFWLSQNQLIRMIRNKKVDIEARLLFGCININKLI